MKTDVALKFGFDLKVLSASYQRDESMLEERVARLEAVAEYIIANEDVGSPDDLTPWIQGVIEAKIIDIDREP